MKQVWVRSVDIYIFCQCAVNVLYFTMIEVGKMNLVGVRSVDVYFVNMRSKVITSRKYIKKMIYL